MQNSPKSEDLKTEVVSENGKSYFLDLGNFPFLANSSFDKIDGIISKNRVEAIEILYNTKYHPQNEYIKNVIDETHIYPCVFAINSKETVLKYSSKNLGHFGVSKVIVNTGRYPYALNDFEGKYGMCQNIFGIYVETNEQAKKICEALNSDKFKEILTATKWNNFNIDYKMFKYFRKDFWKEFI